MEQGMTEIEQHAARLASAIAAGRMTERAAIDDLRASWDVTEVGARDLVSGDYWRRADRELGAR